MSNSKRKETKRRKSASKNIQSVNITLPENLTPDEMQHIIANAILESEEIKAEKEKKQHSDKLDKWHKTIGYSENENKLKDYLNKFKVFIKILFLPKKYIEGDRAFSTLLIMIIQSAFALVKWILMFLAIVFCIYPLLQLFGLSTPIPWFQNVLYIMYGIIAFIFSRLFRMAGIEVEKIEDRNYLIGIFASVTSLISIVIAIIAVVKGN